MNESNQVKYQKFRVIYLVLFETQSKLELIIKSDYMFKFGYFLIE